MQIQVGHRRTRARALVSPPALRALHRYCGAIFAPALLFFALSGILQVFDLHKPRGWGGGDPPAFVRTLAALHKDQRLPVRGKAAAPRTTPPKAAARGEKPERPVGVGQLLLKLYSAAAAAALAVSTVAGLLIGWRDVRRRPWLAGLVAAGVLIPLGLALLS